MRSFPANFKFFRNPRTVVRPDNGSRFIGVRQLIDNRRNSFCTVLRFDDTNRNLSTRRTKIVERVCGFGNAFVSIRAVFVGLLTFAPRRLFSFSNNCASFLLKLCTVCEQAICLLLRVCLLFVSLTGQVADTQKMELAALENTELPYSRS